MMLAHEAARPSQNIALPRIAAGSSFYTAMRILPKERRNAVMAIYAFCRAVDDIADDWTAPRAPRLLALQTWGDHIDHLFGRGEAPDLRWLSDPIRAYKLARSDFHDVIEGMIMDVETDIRAPCLKTLDTYCDYVASAVGRLTSPIFGLPAQSGVDLAHHLGRALQLTNILRDIDEDAAMGRIYLPREMLSEAGLHGAIDPGQIARHDLTLACEPLVQLARQHFMAARAIMRIRPREETRAPLLMADVYEPMLGAMMERGFDPPRRPIKRSKLRMLLLMLGSKLR
jgi:phytoene synthase